MRRGLRLRLALTHALVAVVAIAAVAIIVTVTGGRRFEQYLSDVQQRRDQAVVEVLSETYQPGIGWDAKAVYALSQASVTSGVNVAVYDPGGSLLFTVQGIRRGMMGGMMGQGSGMMGQGQQDGTLSDTGLTVDRYPVVVEGEKVASADIYARQSARVAAEQAYESSLTRNLLVAGVLAGVLAVAVSVLVSRRITGPLEELTDAAADVTAGNLDVRVAPRGDDEVAALASAFNQMADSLARDEQWRRDMTADLSHELRTPLATIQSRIEALEDGVMPATPENLRVIGDEVERLGRLLGELRSLNELESEDFGVTLRPLDLADVGRDGLARVEPLAARRSVRLESRLAEAPADGDRDQLLQVVVNLLDNAIKFTPEGGSVTLAVGPAPPPAGRAGPWASITVSDTGPGIDPIDLPFVFDRFYRSRSVRHTQGAGLGLAIAKGLVEVHNGVIEASDGAGGGAVFTVLLPSRG